MSHPRKARLSWILELELPKDLALEPTLGKSASQLRLVRGIEFENEFEFDD
jgi:hypothetical protein